MKKYDATEYFKHVRGKKTYQTVCKRANISLTYWKKIEAGLSQPSAVVVGKVVAAFGVHPDFCSMDELRRDIIAQRYVAAVNRRQARKPKHSYQGNYAWIAKR